MSTRPWLGLLAAGPMSPALFRIEGLHAHLGPVASATLRVASRLANRLKAGSPVQPELLSHASLILITGQEADFPELLRLATSSHIDWHGRTAVLLDFQHDHSDLAPLRALGAATATLDSLDCFPDSRFVADASPGARRHLQRFATATKSHIFYLNPAGKQIFSAGTAFTGTLLTPLVAASADCIKAAGLPAADALLIAERMVQQTVRAWLKSGRKGWSGALANRDAGSARRQLQALEQENAALRDYFLHTARFASHLFHEDPAWLDTLEIANSPIMKEMDDSQARRLVAAGRLAANLAHDWNNLLTLLGAQAAEIGSTLPPDHPAQSLTAELATAIHHASDSPRRLLNWLREEPGQLVPAPLNEVVRSALPLLQLAVGRGGSVVLDLHPHIPEIPLDAPLLRNALINLASNAASAMKGRGTLTIQTSLAAGQILLTVSDTGPGMDAETRRRVFEPFFTTRHSEGGMGLGMETVKAFAETHHAEVDLHTAPGEGCRFRFTLPLPARAAGA